MADEGADTDTPDAQPAIPEKPADVQFGEDSFNSDITLQETADLPRRCGDAGPGHRRRDRPGRPGAGGAGLHPPGPTRGVRHRRHGLVEQAPRHRAARDTGGKYVGKVIEARKTAETVKPFEYFDKGAMATIGYRSAVADAFGMKFTRFIGYVMWAFIHVFDLIGWGSRLGTLYTWARGIWFGHNRAHRVITFDSAKKELADRSRRAGRYRFCPCPRPLPLRPSGTPAEGVAAP